MRFIVERKKFVEN